MLGLFDALMAGPPLDFWKATHVSRLVFSCSMVYSIVKTFFVETGKTAHE